MGRENVGFSEPHPLGLVTNITTETVRVFDCVTATSDFYISFWHVTGKLQIMD